MLRKIQVIKMRGQRQRPGLHTFRIDHSGLEVFPRVIPVAREGEFRAPVSKERLSTGVPVLDEMLGGGIPIGFSVLLVGPTGSGKTILAGEFLAAGAAKGECGVVAQFERTPNQIMNEKVEALVDSGHVVIMPVRTLDLSIDEMLHELLGLIEKTGASRLVLDSLTGFEMALAPEDREDFEEALYRMSAVLNARGVTVLMTSELEDRFTDLRFSPYGSAVLVDVIIMQRYIEVQSELRTLISVVKVRGSKHSRQLRSFEITDEGVVIGTTVAPYDGAVHGNPQLLA